MVLHREEYVTYQRFESKTTRILRVIEKRYSQSQFSMV